MNREITIAHGCGILQIWEPVVTIRCGQPQGIAPTDTQYIGGTVGRIR